MDRSLMRHVYIHIPFCQRRCSYCDFNTFANMEDRVEPYVAALTADIQRAVENESDWRVRPASSGVAPQLVGTSSTERGLMRHDLQPTIFLGGGTPTMLDLGQMERVLGAVNEIVPVRDAEVTTEANPGTVLDEGYLRGLRDLGINRISFGVQSLHDPTLRMLGRIHTAAEAIETYCQARRAGFERINLDFIFGLPGQTLEQWRWTLDQIIALDIDHLSLYSLILEEGTPLHRQVMGGAVAIPDDDLAGAMYDLAMERMEAAGYAQYEISNWARRDRWGDAPLPAQAAQHNVAYWLNADYAAFGAGAHGHVYPRRWHDILHVEQYIEAGRVGDSMIAEVTDLSETDLQSETMMMGLRLNLGVGYAHFRERCGVDLRDVYGVEVAELVSMGLLVQDDIGIRLSDRGRAVANQVFLRFLR
jgi:oxygen-independent coproporphyrinogen III oxidase